MEASTVILPVLLRMHAHVCALTTCDDDVHAVACSNDPQKTAE